MPGHAALALKYKNRRPQDDGGFMGDATALGRVHEFPGRRREVVDERSKNAAISFTSPMICPPATHSAQSAEAHPADVANPVARAISLPNPPFGLVLDFVNTT